MSDDLLKKTAAAMFNVAENDVTPDQKRIAQTATFGLRFGRRGAPTPEATVQATAAALGADRSTCVICGITTHQMVDGVFTKIAEHGDLCQVVH